MSGEIKNNNPAELKRFLLDGIYKSIGELKNTGKPESDRFKYLLDLAEFAGNPNNAIAIQANPDNASNFILVDGLFPAEDANNILSVLYNSKIDFHVRSAVSHDLRNGEPSPAHIKRISELQEEFDRVKELITLSRECKMKMKINAVINIELIP